MMDLPEVECLECGWQGDYSELCCSDADAASNKPANDIRFDRCPECDKSDSIEDYED